MAEDQGPGSFFSFLDSPAAGAGAAALGAGGDIWNLLQNLQAKGQQQQVFQGLTNPQQLMAGYPGLSQGASAAALRDINSNYAITTGGAPGGAYRQAVADAMSKIEMDSLLKYLGIRSNALQGAQGAIPGQQPLGALGGILKNLQILRQIGQRPQQQQPYFQVPNTVQDTDMMAPPVTLESGTAA